MNAMSTWKILGFDKFEFPPEPYLVEDGLASFEDAQAFLESYKEAQMEISGDSQTYQIAEVKS